MKPRVGREGAKGAGERGYLGGVPTTAVAAPYVDRKSSNLERCRLPVEDEGERPASPGATPFADGGPHLGLTPAEL